MLALELSAVEGAILGKAFAESLPVFRFEFWLSMLGFIILYRAVQFVDYCCIYIAEFLYRIYIWLLQPLSVSGILYTLDCITLSCPSWKKALLFAANRKLCERSKEIKKNQNLWKAKSD